MRGEPLTPFDPGDCDECGGSVGPFVKFGGGTMSSEDCTICRKCIAEAFARIGNGWIPVSERLPDISERVLIFCPLLEPDEIIGSTLAANGIWECDDGQILGETEPTHWMPLPLPPEVK